PGESRAMGRAWVQAAALLLVLVSAAARAPGRGDGVPRFAISALVVCLVLYGAQGALTAWQGVRRRLAAHPLARELNRFGPTSTWPGPTCTRDCSRRPSSRPSRSRRS